LDESEAVLESACENYHEPEGDWDPAEDPLRFPESSEAPRLAKVASANAPSGFILLGPSGYRTGSATPPVCVYVSIAGIGGGLSGSAHHCPASHAPFPKPKVHHESAPRHDATGDFDCPAATLTAESAPPRPTVRLLVPSILSRLLQAHPRTAWDRTSSFVTDSRGGLRRTVCDSPEAR
jgi:hypothetical protein